MTEEHKACESMDVFQALDAVNKAIVNATSSKEMLSSVLEVVLDVFDCHRAWLLYPCTRDTKTFQVPMECTRPDYPGAGILDEPLPVDDYVQGVLCDCLDSEVPVIFDIEHGYSMDHEIQKHFNIRSQVMMSVEPKNDLPWAFGIHHCEDPKVYREVAPLFQVDHSKADWPADSLRVATGTSARYQASTAAREPCRYLRTYRGSLVIRC